jgi:hypothetical protein
MRPPTAQFSADYPLSAAAAGKTQAGFKKPAKRDPMPLASPGSSSINVPAIAFSPAVVLYLINRDDSAFPGDWLYSLDVNTGQGHFFGPTGLNAGMQGLACAPNGTLYGWHTGIGLVTINPGNWNATDVNVAVGAPAEIQCLGFSPDGTFYGARMALYIVNPTTGLLSLVGGTLADIRGLEFIPTQPPKLTISRTANGVRVCTMTRSNKTYPLQYRADLGGAITWANLGAAIAVTGGEVCVTNNVGAGRQFYQLAVTTP